MAKITLFTREDCHLCEVAYSELEHVRAIHPFHLEVVDLDREAPEVKRAAYDWEVPVIELDGRKIMKFRVEGPRLLRLLALADEVRTPGTD